MFLKTQILFLILLSVSPAYAVRILIDPGHGGYDKGAQASSQSESHVAWTWSLELKRILQDRNFEVELTRNETSGLSLQKRIHKLNQKKFDLVISLHANYLIDSRVKGIEYFIAAPLDLEDQKLQLAHEEIQIQKGQKKISPLLASLNEEKKSQVTAILNDLQQQSKLEKSLRIATKLNQIWPGKIKQGPFDLLTQSQSPAILIELGYLSNPTDHKNLIDPQFRLQKSLMISDALTSYFENQKIKQVD